MAEDVDQWLGNLDGAAVCDHRNGACRRNLPSELGDIELKVPRTRRSVSVIGSYARRAPEINRAILAGFVPGLSTRKVGETWPPGCALQPGDPGCGGPGLPPVDQWLQGSDERGA